MTGRAVAVVIMAKAPRAGTVKTRLCPPLRPAEAAELARCFLKDKIDQVRALKRAYPVVAFTPEDARTEFEALAPGFTLITQRGADLGERLLTSLAALLGRGHHGAIAIDSDTPTLPTAFLQEAVDRLIDSGVDIVLGPTDDGGYYLIGLRQARAELFEAMPWSTPGVLDETLRRAAAARLRTVCLSSWFDVDTPDDLGRLRQALAHGREAGPVHTADFLLGRRP